MSRFIERAACWCTIKNIDGEELRQRLPENDYMNENPHKHPKDPLEGKTLKAILTELYEHFGWDGLSRQLSINCFEENPSITSSLKFLRKTPWARARVEMIYLSFIQGKLNQQCSDRLRDPEAGDKDR